MPAPNTPHPNPDAAGETGAPQGGDSGGSDRPLVVIFIWFRMNTPDRCRQRTGTQTEGRGPEYERSPRPIRAADPESDGPPPHILPPILPPPPSDTVAAKI